MASLLEQLRSARTFSVEVLPGQPNKRLRFLRPTAAQMPRLRGGITQELLAEHALPWEGITEADVLPGGIGGDSPAAFDAELLRELLEDRRDHGGLCGPRGVPPAGGRARQPEPLLAGLEQCAH